MQIEQIHPINPPKNDYCEDLVELYHLNESTVFYNLRQRFLKDWIYVGYMFILYLYNDRHGVEIVWCQSIHSKIYKRCILHK